MGGEALHCASTARAQFSQAPHWVARPNSNWISSKPRPARAWRAISWSEIRRHTQTIMVAGGLKSEKGGRIINTNPSHLKNICCRHGVAVRGPSPSVALGGTGKGHAQAHAMTPAGAGGRAQRRNDQGALNVGGATQRDAIQRLQRRHGIGRAGKVGDELSTLEQ